MLSVYLSINSSLKIKLNNSSHLFSQLLKSVLSDVDALTRLLYEILYRELVKCNKLWVLREFVKVVFQKSFPDPSWLHWYSLHITFKNLSSLHLWHAHRKKTVWTLSICTSILSAWKDTYKIKKNEEAIFLSSTK